MTADRNYVVTGDHCDWPMFETYEEACDFVDRYGGVGWDRDSIELLVDPHEIGRLWAVLDEAYREDSGLSVWHDHPELGLQERYVAWLDAEEARENREREA